MAESLRLEHSYTHPTRGAAQGEDSPATLAVPGLSLPDKCPLVGGWTRQNNIFLHCMRLKTDEDRHETDERQTTVYEVSWERAQWNHVTRKLVNQSHRYFMDLQEASSREHGLDGVELVHYSRYYRSALHECVLGLRKMAKECGSLEDQSSYTQQSHLYSMMELAWHLCEVIFIEVLPPGCLIQQLLEWVCWHSGGAEEEIVQTLLATPQPEDNSAYWKTVTWLVLKGKLSEVRSLLSHHSSAHTIPHVFASIDELLRKAPMVYSTVSRSRSELHRQWQEWKSECIRRRDGGDFIGVPWLNKIVKIFCGEDVFYDSEIMDCCSHWYELMVGVLLYKQPLVVSTDFDLTFTAKEVRDNFPSIADGDLEGALDQILLATFHNDIMEVIKVASSRMSSWWFVAHLTNLVEHKEAVEHRLNPEFKGPLMTASYQHMQDTPLSEFLLLEYGCSLLGHGSLWQVAMDYFSVCPSKGKEYMKLCLERVPMETEKKALKVLHVCEQHQLIETARSICKELAMKAYKNGRPGVAFSWCIRGKDSAFAGFLAEKYFENYKNVGEFLDLDLLDHLGDTILMNERLMFLAKYREYHQLFEKGEIEEGGRLLVSLLTSNTVPKKFWSTLLTDALQLFEREELAFSSDHTNALSHVVQELILAPPEPDDSDILDPSTAALLDKERTALLQLALTRNLCRALLEESAL